jgi:hypothetical protein
MGTAASGQLSKAELLARLYDWEHDVFQDDVELYSQLARRTGGPVLELACGSGRVLAGLAAAGVDVVGVDHDPAMLARARYRLRDAACSVNLVEAALGDPLPPGPFACVVLALDAFGLVRECDGQLTLLRQIHARLAPAGLVVLDLTHAAALAAQSDAAPQLQRTGADHDLDAHVTKWIVRQVRPARDEMTLLSFYDVVWGDGTLTRHTAEVPLRYFSRHEVELLLAVAGFETEAVYGDYELRQLADDSERMIFVAQPGKRRAADGIQSAL